MLPNIKSQRGLLIAFTLNSNLVHNESNQASGAARKPEIDGRRARHIRERRCPPCCRYRKRLCGGGEPEHCALLAYQINERSFGSQYRQEESMSGSQFLTSRRWRKIGLVPPENGADVGLASALEAGVKNIFKMAKETFEKDGPLLVVASCRDTISIASSIKRLASENVFLVQVQHPRSHLNRFDMMITPQHAYYSLTPQAQEQSLAYFGNG